MRKIFWLIIILNFILLVPKFKSNLPILKSQLSGDLKAASPLGIQVLLNAFAWLKAQKEKGEVPQDVVVVCSKPQFCYYYTGLRSVNFPFSEKRDLIFKELIKADLIISENLLILCTSYLNPVLKDSVKYFRVIYLTHGQPPDLVISQVKKEEVAKLINATGNNHSDESK